MAQDKEIPQTGSFKLAKDGSTPERVAPIPIVPGVEGALDKMNEGAKLAELDDLEQRKVQLNAYKMDEARILAEVAKEKGPPKPVIEKNYGMLGDIKTTFALIAEQVGMFNRNTHPTVTYKDLAIFKTKGNHKTGFEENYEHVDVAATRENIERLINLKAIRPLVFQG